MSELKIPGGGFVNLENVPGFGGSPEQVALAGRELTRIGGRLRAQSRASSIAGAQATRSWQGSASIAYANRNNGQVRSAAAGAREIDRAGKTTGDFATALRRIQGEATDALRRRERQEKQLREALRDRRQMAVGSGGETAGVDAEIAALRRGIGAQTRIIQGLDLDLTRLRRKYGGDLLHLMPPELLAWYLMAKGGRATHKNVKAMLAAPRAATEMGKAVRAHQQATRAGDAKRAATAMKDYQAARGTLLKVPGNPLGRLAKLEGFERTWIGGRLVYSWAGRKVDAAGKLDKLHQGLDKSVLAKTMRRYAGPIGTVSTIHDAGTDAFTGGGKDGAQGRVTQATGVGATAGAIALGLGVGGPAAAGAIALWLSWKAGMAIWDRSRSYRPPVDFRTDTRAQRLRLYRLRMRGKIDPDPANLEHRLYVEQGAGPLAGLEKARVAR